MSKLRTKEVKILIYLTYTLHCAGFGNLIKQAEQIFDYC